MATAKELIEKEIKEAELSYKMNDRRSGDYIAGILKGLKTALEHVENACQSQHSKLSIPKKIAEELDKFFEIDFESLGHEEWWIQEHELIEWFSKTPNCYIKDAYLAGKALGVDLVEVEG